MVDKKFLNLTKNNEFSAVKHNTTDYSSFADFQKRLNGTYAQYEAKKRAEVIDEMIREWESRLPSRWRSASLAGIKNDAAREVERILSEKGPGSFFIRGENQAGKTYLAYAIARSYIKTGIVTPSQVKTINEVNLMKLPKLGFTGHQRLDEMMRSNTKLYIFDDVGRSSYDDMGLAIWEQMLDHIYSNSLMALFTSPGSSASFFDKLSTTAASKFQHLVENRSIIMYRDEETTELGDWTPTEIESHEKTSALFNSFKKS